MEFSSFCHSERPWLVAIFDGMDPVAVAAALPCGALLTLVGICEHCEDARTARSVEGARSVITGDNAVTARSVEGARSAITGDNAVTARSVGGARSAASSAITGDNALNAVTARSVGGAASVSTSENAAGARSAK